MSASKAPIFRSTMLTLIKTALAGQTEVEITYGSTSVGEANDLVFVHAPTARRSYAYLGSNNMTELLDLDVTISSFRGDDVVNASGQSTQQVASERAWALFALIEARIRTDITLGLAQPFFITDGKAVESETNEEDATQGRYSTLTVTFTAETKI